MCTESRGKYCTLYSIFMTFLVKGCTVTNMFVWQRLQQIMSRHHDFPFSENENCATTKKHSSPPRQSPQRSYQTVDNNIHLLLFLLITSQILIYLWSFCCCADKTNIVKVSVWEVVTAFLTNFTNRIINQINHNFNIYQLKGALCSFEEAKRYKVRNVYFFQKAVLRGK